MGFKSWLASVHLYWKREAYSQLANVSFRVMGSQPFEGFPLTLWWLSFTIVLFGLTINGIVLTVRHASILEAVPVERDTTGAVCLCNSLVSNYQILEITPNQTAFGNLTPIYNSSLTLAKIWNSGSTFISSWTVPLNWNGLVEESKQTFLNSLNVMKTTVQLTLVLFGNGTVSDNALSQLAELEIEAYADSFIYYSQPDNPAICPTATCVLSSYPSVWTLFIRFLTVVVSSNLIVYLVVNLFLSLFWNIIEFGKTEKGQILEG